MVRGQETDQVKAVRAEKNASGSGEGASGGKTGDAAPAGMGQGVPQGPPPTMVRVGLVKKEILADQWEVVGRLREVRRSVVATEQLGKVIEVGVDEGTEVVGGQTVLARIDDTWVKLSLDTAQAQLKQAQALVVEAEAQEDLSKRELERLETLLEARSARPKEVDDARARYQMDEAKLEYARAQTTAGEVAVARVEAERLRLEILAPFDGVVVKKMVEVGQWANQGTAVAEVVSRGLIDAEIDVPERLVNNMAIGQEIGVFVEPVGKEVVGKVRAIVPMGSNGARTFPVRVSLNDQQGRLKPGMSVLAAVPRGQKVEVFTVPRDAVVRQATGTIVWAAANGVALPVSVDVLFGSGDCYAVRASAGNAGPPLHEGLAVVIEGAERLWPKRPVIAKQGGAGTVKSE